MKGVGHGMKSNKIILVILISVLFISAMVMGAFYLIDREEAVSVENGGDEMALTEEQYPISLENGRDEMTLTEQQYQLLEDSILLTELEDMSNIRRRNAWIFLNAMAEIGFVEGRYPGQSSVSRATWVLDVLGVGEIQELEIVNYENDIYDPDRGKYGVNGQLIWDVVMHHITEDGQICEREYPRGPVINCE